jgi:hypothetical protein
MKTEEIDALTNKSWIRKFIDMNPKQLTRKSAGAKGHVVSAGIR